MHEGPRNRPGQRAKALASVWSVCADESFFVWVYGAVTQGPSQCIPILQVCLRSARVIHDVALQAAVCARCNQHMLRRELGSGRVCLLCEAEL